MCKLIFGCVFLSCVLSCGDHDDVYINHKKWIIPNIYNSTALKGSPKEVKLSKYGSLNDTLLTSSGKLSDYELHKFDNSGNIVFTRIYIAGVSVTDVTYDFDKNGVQYKAIFYYDSSGTRVYATNKGNSVRVKKNTYKTKFYRDNTYRDEIIETFSQAGQTVKQEKWEKDSLIASQISYYWRGKLKRTEIIAKPRHSENVYYYSGKGYLDSILFFENNNKTSKTEYINNELGDPLLYLVTGNGKVKEKSILKYQYDEKGNWVKQLIRTEKSEFNYGIHEGPFPEYSIQIREIKY